MYVVTAVDERPGPPAAPDGRGFHTSAARGPVGVQHAVPRCLRHVFQTVALCGAQVSGSAVFPEMPSAPERAASCQRCAQLVSAARLAANCSLRRHSASA
jgi:hypothetical protein